MTERLYALTQPEIIEHLQTDGELGLSVAEVRSRQVKFGPNELFRESRMSLWRAFVNQLSKYLVLVLISVAVFLGLTGTYAQAVAVLLMVTARAAFGIIQESRIEHSRKIIKKLTGPMARVIRDGREFQLTASELVPGDLVLLNRGDLVPADLRLLQTKRLTINEVAVTGVSSPVEKTAEALADVNLPLGAIFNMAYFGTAVTGGYGRGLVVKTGMATEAGLLSSFMRSEDRIKTPFQRRLEQLDKHVMVPYLLLCLLIAALGINRGGEIDQMFLTAICLAAAAGPWNLPAVATAAQAAGIRRLIGHKVYWRRIFAMGALSNVTVLCTAKSGTLTQSKMTVRQVALGGQTLEVFGEGYDPKGNFSGPVDIYKAHFNLLMKASALCNNASLQRGGITVTGIFRGLTSRGMVKDWSIMGEPAEGALLVMAAKAGCWREKIEEKELRVAELPFSPARKRMSVIYRRSGGSMEVYMKGAPEVILGLCTHTYKNGLVIPLSDRERQEKLMQTASMAASSQHVLAFAWRELPAGDRDFSEKNIEKRLVFIGLAGMADPLRPDAHKVVHSCRRAGIKVVLLTGDHPLTAEALAGQLNVFDQDGRVLTGPELEQMTEEQLLEIASKTSVYARVTLEQKLRVIEALKKSGQVVAVAGSGASDALAVQSADVGIAIDVTGAGVTREAAGIILADDQLGGIVTALKEEKEWFASVEKAAQYLLVGSVGSVVSVLIAVLVGLPVPLTPVQILWSGLIAGALPAVALVMGPCVVRQTHRQRDNLLVDGPAWGHIVTGGLVTGIGTLLAFWIGLSMGNEALARAMCFNTFVFSQLALIFNYRIAKHGVLETGFTLQPYLIGAVFGLAALQLALNYVSWLQPGFGTAFLSRLHWACIIAITAAPAGLRTLFRLCNKVGKKFMFLRV
ncbi:MAG: Calcium-transporting ATPase [Pelotomaculum sp. PtaB.Bin104]|nr:MAG: Calcium-transporting ATPase [Pelotomaculum sp. PtaB.Bin104]